jgi:hypothetical protein
VLLLSALLTPCCKAPASLPAQELEARFTALLGSQNQRQQGPAAPAAGRSGFPPVLPTSPTRGTPVARPAAAAAAATPSRSGAWTRGVASSPRPGGGLLGSASAGVAPVSPQTRAFVAALARGTPLGGLDDVPAAVPGAGGSSPEAAGAAAGGLQGEGEAEAASQLDASELLAAETAQSGASARCSWRPGWRAICGSLPGMRMLALPGPPLPGRRVSLMPN